MRRMLIGGLLTFAAATGLVACGDGVRAAPAGPPLAGRFGGVNLAGGEFAPKRVPARYGADYVYPDASDAGAFLAAGLTAVRVPVRWERLQPAPMKPLDARELARLDRSLDALSGFEVVVLDVHNYARVGGQRLDLDPGGAAMLADLWTRLAERYRNRSYVAFGMMNEPYKIAAADWRAIANSTIAAIRRTGAKNLVLVPGTRWTGAHSWEAGGAGSNAAAMAGFTDPGGNFAFELHQYLDANSSGTSKTCVAPDAAAQRLAAATDWLRREHARGVLAEFGASRDPACVESLEALLRTMDEGGDVWLGWTYWAAGRRWHDYPFDIQPRPGREDDPRLALLARHVPRR